MKRTIITLMTLLACLSASADWKYSTPTDAMTSKPIKLAVLQSDNSLDLDRPYSGVNYGNLVIRQSPRQGLDIMFSVDKGQIICDRYNGCAVSVRFDDAPPMRFNAGGSSDHDSKVLFLRNESKFVAAAAKAKRILVQVVIYQAGQQVLEFSSPKPLEWKPK